MLNETEKIIANLDYVPMSSIRTAYINRVRLEHERYNKVSAWFGSNGFEPLAISADQLLTDDGREVLRAHGKAWALRPEVHAQRLSEAIDQARQRDAAIAAQATEPLTQLAICPALIDGQLCGGTLSATPVCPRCTLGKQGVAQVLTCDVCGAQTAVMR